MVNLTSRHVLKVLQRQPSCSRYWLAYSGGRDSHVLLHALAALGVELSAPIQVVHVDHGLQPHSEQWALHCQSVCKALNLPFVMRRVDARPDVGQSPEAAARKARYSALAELMGAGDVLLTAHHQDDQAETLMLQLLRGAGPRGLAAMPECKDFDGGFLVRPLLTFSRADLEDYARQHKLRWLDDPSNDEQRFRRNYLRHEVMPRIQAQWPAFARTMARSADLCADAAVLLDQLAEQDLSVLALGEGLSVTGLQALDPVRQRNVLRYWCASKSLPLPNQVHMHQIQQQIFSVSDSMPLICWPGAELRRYQGCLLIMPPLSRVDADLELGWDMVKALDLPHGRLFVIAGGVGDFDAGVSTQTIKVRFRRGGERFLSPTGRHQSLKKFLQQQRVAPWLRDRIPLIYINDELAAIAGLWVCERFAARPGQASLRLDWQPF